MIKIAVIEARGYDGKLLFAEGADCDGYSTHQVIVPISSFSDAEIKKFGDKNSEYPFAYIKDNGTGNINIGEQEAKDHCRNFDKFKIELKYIEYK